jgi:organic radical activating enzyme
MPAPATSPTEGQLIEVFSSIQGEGLMVGCRQIFLRLAGCNLHCAYCDTPFAPTADCQVEEAPGSGTFRALPNPVSLPTILTLLEDWLRWTPGVHHSLSLTGGEPLLHGELLENWLPELARLLPVHLETNGTLPEALTPLLSHLAFISMDLKLASVTGCPTPWDVHQCFLGVARNKPGQAKAVVGPETAAGEIEAAARLLQETAPEWPLILQALTVDGKVAVSGRDLLALQETAARIHPPVRVIPQTHRLLGVL